MKNLYYLISAALFILWFLGFVILNAGASIHFIFLVGVLVLVVQLIIDYKEK